MKLKRVKIVKAATCGGLLDGFELWLRGDSANVDHFDPLCLVGPNGAGKSQFLQVLAEILQSLSHACSPEEEPVDGNPDLQFELEYLIRPTMRGVPVHARVSRVAEVRRRPVLKIERRTDSGWEECPAGSAGARELLPSKVIGYTSGDNETLSLPFLVSRRGYSERVAEAAFAGESSVGGDHVPDPRLILIDYATHLEVLVANLLLGAAEERQALLSAPNLRDLDSFRCVVQLAHGAVPRRPARAAGHRKGVQLTAELEAAIDHLKRCSTCYSYEEKTETYVFDFRIDAAARTAFRHFWASAWDLYAALHKLAMLNDLAIPKAARERLFRDMKTRRFASRLPEPQDEERVFRFERVRFSSSSNNEVVDYVSLSDGEHQLAQLLGTMCMASSRNVVFLLDEPESHFNPQWRVKFISQLRALPTANGSRTNQGEDACQQECLLTTHAPFVPSDMARQNVLIFKKGDGKVRVERPAIETFGTTFDTILEECFGVRPPISGVSNGEIQKLMASTDAVEIRDGLGRFGDSVEKVLLIDRARQLEKKGA